MAQGASNRAIAGNLFVSHNTVKTHLRNIRDKLNLINMRQVVAYAARAGLVESDRLPGSRVSSQGIGSPQATPRGLLVERPIAVGR